MTKYKTDGPTNANKSVGLLYAAQANDTHVAKSKNKLGCLLLVHKPYSKIGDVFYLEFL